MAQSDATASQVVSAAPVAVLSGTPLTHEGALIGQGLGVPRLEAWAPAWFYSALSWLGKSYVDAGNSTQAFQRYLIGSDVDPTRISAPRGCS